MTALNIGFQSFDQARRILDELVERLKPSRVEISLFPIAYDTLSQSSANYHILVLNSTPSNWEWLDMLLQIRRSQRQIPIILLVPKGGLKEKITRLKVDRSLIIIDDPALLEGILKKFFAPPPEAKKRVLFVDDDPNVLSGYKRTFYKAPWEVLTASGARQAIEMLGTQKIDLLVTDIKMPGMHGFQLIEEVRKENRELPIIVCSGYHGMKKDADVFFLNVSAFIEKPVNMATLLETINRILPS